MRLVVDGIEHYASAGPQQRLLWVLREQLGLTAAKPGCGEGVCGACTVLVGDEPVRSCMLTVGEVGERPVTTLEGLAPAGQLHPLQQAFLELAAPSADYCHPRVTVAALECGLLDERLLQRMELSGRCQPLQRRHRSLPDLAHRNDARAHRLAADEDRARPADALAAAGLRGGQSQLFSENPQQRLLWPGGRVVLDTVDDQPHRPGHSGRRAKKTSSRPGRSSAPRTSSTMYTCSATATQTFSRSPKRREGRLGCQHFAVGEHACRAEADQRQGHVRQLDPALDAAHAVHLRDAVRRGAVPLVQRLGCRVSGLEHQAPVGPQGVMDTTQRSFPVLLLDNRLATFRSWAARSTRQRRQRRCVPADPAHALSFGLGACDIERRTRRIDTNHLQTPAG